MSVGSIFWRGEVISGKLFSEFYGTCISTRLTRANIDKLVLVYLNNIFTVDDYVKDSRPEAV